MIDFPVQGQRGNSVRGENISGWGESRRRLFAGKGNACLREKEFRDWGKSDL